MSNTGTTIMQTPNTNEARKPPGRPFGPDNKPKGGSERGRRHLPRLLKEMRLIVERGLPANPSNLQQKLHDQFENNFDRYIDRLVKLEAAWAAGAAKEKPPTAGDDGLLTEDEGTAKALSILASWLDEHGVKREGAA
jgi:hypothetical protein